MNESSRLLIYEMVMEPLHRYAPQYEAEEGIGAAPEPLPPNYGARWQFQKDLIMMNLFQGKERNRQEWSDLVRKVGLKVLKLWTVCGMESCILECKREAEK